MLQGWEWEEYAGREKLGGVDDAGRVDKLSRTTNVHCTMQLQNARAGVSVCVCVCETGDGRWPTGRTPMRSEVSSSPTSDRVIHVPS